MTTTTDTDARVGYRARRLIEGLQADGGATLRLNDGAVPRQGYVVGRKGQGIVLPAAMVSPLTVESWLRVVADVEYVGIWRDETDGSVYLDVVDVFDNSIDAYRATTDRGEIAFYDIGQGREHRVAA